MSPSEYIRYDTGVDNDPEKTNKPFRDPLSARSERLPHLDNGAGDTLKNHRSYKELGPQGKLAQLTRSSLVTAQNVDKVLATTNGRALSILSFLDAIDSDLLSHDFGDQDVTIHHLPIRSPTSLAKRPELIDKVVNLVIQLLDAGEHVHLHCLMGETRTGLFCAAVLQKLGINKAVIASDFRKGRKTWPNILGRGLTERLADSIPRESVSAVKAYRHVRTGGSLGSANGEVPEIIEAPGLSN